MILIYKKTAYSLIAIAIAAILGWFYAAPIIARHVIISSLHKSGFADAKIDNITTIHGGLLIDHIQLDKNGFSEATNVQILISPKSFFLPQNIKIKSISLLGEMDQNGKITIAGFTPSKNESYQASKQNYAALFPLKELSLDGINIDIDTPAGIVAVQGKIFITKNSNKLDIQISSWAEQSALTYNATAQGSWTEQSGWIAEADIQDARMNIQPYKATRLSGKISINNNTWSGKIKAGALKYKETGVNNATIIINEKAPHITIAAENPANTGATIGTNLTFQRNDNTINTSWTIALNNTPALNGTLSYNLETEKLTGLLNSTDIPLQEIEKFIGKDAIKNLSIESGTLKINGNISLEKTSKEPVIEGQGQITLKNASLDYSGYKIKNLNSAINIANWLPFKTQERQKATIEKITSTHTFDNAEIIYNLMPIHIHTATANIAQGTISSADFTLVNNSTNKDIILTLKNLSIQEIINKAEIKGLETKGTISGIIPLNIKSGKLNIKEAKIISDNAGSIQYTPDTFPPALSGDTPHMQTVRQALSDFRFESLNIALDGDLDNDMKTTLKASGKNPIFGDRPINLNLNLEGALAPAILQTLQPSHLADKLKENYSESTKQ